LNKGDLLNGALEKKKAGGRHSSPDMIVKTREVFAGITIYYLPNSYPSIKKKLTTIVKGKSSSA
jgi:hypothetical protein